MGPSVVDQEQIMCTVRVFWPKCLFDSRVLQNMVYRLGDYMSCFVSAACSQAGALGEPGRLYGDAAARPNYILKLQPPEKHMKVGESC